MTTRLVMVDAGGSNLTSVQAAFARLGVDAPITHDWDEIQAASHVVLPGVGAALPAMQRLRNFALVEKLPTLKQPVLGVCVGMQLLFERSEEGDVPCLGVIPGAVGKLPSAPGIRVPHMGWNVLEGVNSHPITRGLEQRYAYFVHSFAAGLSANTLMRCEHGSGFAAVAASGNFIGAQFHPERSQHVGAQLLKNFLELA